VLVGLPPTAPKGCRIRCGGRLAGALGAGSGGLRSPVLHQRRANLVAIGFAVLGDPAVGVFVHLVAAALVAFERLPKGGSSVLKHRPAGDVLGGPTSAICVVTPAAPGFRAAEANNLVGRL